MEWSLDVNDMLKNDITKITNSLIPPGFEGDVRSIRLMQDSLSKVINHLGEQSAAAQGLSKVITTAEKLRTADSHTLYLLKDANAKDGKGEVLGMLKVGRKHLFLFDEKETVREVEPLCVLDFFVLKEYQRHGVGKTLFNYMLQDMQTTAHRLAVDGPSDNMVEFLRKNYGVTSLLRQNNNFAVSPLFFHELASDVRCWTRRKDILCAASKSDAGPPTPGAAVGRYTAPKPHSSIADVIHGGVPFNSNGEDSASERAAASPSPAPSPSVAPPAAPPAAPPTAPPAAAADAHRSPLRPRTLPVSAVTDAPPAPLAAPLAPSEPTPAGAPSRRDSQLTDKGFFDVKFYHKKLW